MHEPCCAIQELRIDVPAGHAGKPCNLERDAHPIVRLMQRCHTFGSAKNKVNNDYTLKKKRVWRRNRPQTKKGDVSANHTPPETHGSDKNQPI
jgi:hypothetical protein